MIKPIEVQYPVRKVTISSEQDAYGIADCSAEYTDSVTAYVQYVTRSELNKITQKFIDDLTSLNNKKSSEMSSAQNKIMFNQKIK